MFIIKEGFLEMVFYRKVINLVMRKVCFFLIRGNIYIGRIRFRIRLCGKIVLLSGMGKF